jgi:hypothetical protein
LAREKANEVHQAASAYYDVGAEYADEMLGRILKARREEEEGNGAPS